MNNAAQSSTRNQIMDFLKGVGILYVVLGHTFVNPMHDFIYLFHMPLFYFISGFLYNDNYSIKPVQLLVSRIKTLYIPFLKYELIFLILHNIFFKIYIYVDNVSYNGTYNKLYTSHDYIINFLHIITFGGREQLLGTFWFLTVLFTVNILFCFLRYVLLKKIHNRIELYCTIIILLFYFLGSLLQFKNVTLPRHIQISLVAILIFYLGFLYKKYLYWFPINKWLAIVCIIILYFGTIYANAFLYKSMILKTFLWVFFSLCGIYFNIYIAQSTILKNNRLILFIGKNTIIIMALHFLCFKIINLLQVLYYNYSPTLISSFPVINGSNGWWIAYLIAGIFIPILLKWIYSIFKQKLFSDI